jgi:hypothetical protein
MVQTANHIFCWRNNIYLSLLFNFFVGETIFIYFVVNGPNCQPYILLEKQYLFVTFVEFCCWRNNLYLLCCEWSKLPTIYFVRETIFICHFCLIFLLEKQSLFVTVV